MSTSLDDLSLSFAGALFGLYPDWRRHAREEARPSGEGAFLAVEVPPPAGAGHDHRLWIDTDGEITIGFAEWHGHSPWPPDESYMLGDPIETIARILDEAYVVESVYEEGCLRRSSLAPFEPGQDVDPRPGRVLRVRVTSWRGSHNRTYEVFTP
jgi:hypothetical protein